VLREHGKPLAPRHVKVVEEYIHAHADAAVTPRCSPRWRGQPAQPVCGISRASRPEPDDLSAHGPPGTREAGSAQ
jgi:hypothetical protein